jgi:hypothetical protein
VVQRVAFFSGFSGSTVNVATYNWEICEGAIENHARADGDEAA